MAKRGPRPRDLTGQRFGRLTALAPEGGVDADGRILWRCRCDCGGSTVVAGRWLTRNESRSCGCLRRENGVKLGKRSGGNVLRDLTGQRFGRLTVLNYVRSPGRGGARWRCRCDCGATKEVAGQPLTSGAIQSCGCLKRGRRIRIIRLGEAMKGIP
jgi:hypothetical protein